MLGCGGAPANRDADQAKAAIGTDTGTDITPAVGAVQADLHLEYLQAGDNAAKASYLHRIDLCEQMGLGGARLDAAEVDRLGTARVQLWTTPERSAARLERYQWVNGPIESRRHCEFSARVDGVHYYVDRDTLTTIDLRTGNVTSEPTPYAHLWQRGAVSGEEVRGGTTTSRHGMSCMEYPLGHPDSTAGGGVTASGRRAAPAASAPVASRCPRRRVSPVCSMAWSSIRRPTTRVMASASPCGN